MLTGEIKIHNEPTKYKYTYNNTDSFELTKEMIEEHKKCLSLAEKQGFIIGAKVRRKSFNQHEVGEIVEIEKDADKACDWQGNINIIGVAWPNVGGKSSYKIFYTLLEIEVIE